MLNRKRAGPAGGPALFMTRQLGSYCRLTRWVLVPTAGAKRGRKRPVASKNRGGRTWACPFGTTDFSEPRLGQGSRWGTWQPAWY